MAQWFRWFPGDYLRDTGALSLTENGAYRVLLDHYYSTGGKLKADMVQLFRICRAIEEEERNAVGRVVRDFFTVDEDGWLRNKRADREIVEMAEFHKSRSDAGRKGNAKRWGSHSESPSDRTAIREQSHEDRQPQPQPQETNTKPKTSAFALPDWVDSDTWSDFVEVRKKVRAPLTDRAASLILKSLAELRANGHDPKAVLEQSIANGWKGVFPLKAQSSQQPDNRFAGML